MNMMSTILISAALSVPVTARACDLALVLAVDVSGSVDTTEYRIQMDGLAAGLRDGVVSEALVRANAAVALVQWSGTSRQRTVVDWVRIASFEDTEMLARQIEETPRAWRNFSTAIGEALQHGTNLFDAVPDCRRRVMDVSGDGQSNEGVEPVEVQRFARAAGVTVNALVIETDDTDLTGYFWENVITGEGAFVVTANGFEDYPERIRQKLVRETTRQISKLEQ